MFLLSVQEPTFVSMAQMPEGEMSADGDDDKVYLFFSETAVECDCYNKLVVSRVARVCKVSEFIARTLIFPCNCISQNHYNIKTAFPLSFSCSPFCWLCILFVVFFCLSVGHFVVFLCSQGDLGGERTLQKKWTSFLKARIDCPVLESRLPYIIQDTYRWCDSQMPWKECLFYAVFTPQSYV